MGDLFRIYRQRIESRPDAGAEGQDLKKQALARIAANWPGLMQTPPRKVTIHDIATFAGNLRVKAKVTMPKGAKSKRKGYSPGIVKRTLEVLQQVLKVGIESGALSTNPFDQKGQLSTPLMRTATVKRIELPGLDKMEALFAAIGTPPAEHLTDPRVASGLRSNALDCLELARGLAYSGMRLKEAAAFVWEDVGSDAITVRGTKTENSRDRIVPIVPAMRRLLDDMRARREAQGWPCAGKVFRVSECQKTLDRSCNQVGVKRLTHHDFRHYFATVCIESGVDIPTVSRWLGHSDGGALAMRTYGHLRKEHSQQQAAKVQFGA